MQFTIACTCHKFGRSLVIYSIDLYRSKHRKLFLFSTHHIDSTLSEVVLLPIAMDSSLNLKIHVLRARREGIDRSKIHSTSKSQSIPLSGELLRYIPSNNKLVQKVHRSLRSLHLSLRRSSTNMRRADDTL
jgi:hypothetical protein